MVFYLLHLIYRMLFLPKPCAAGGKHDWELFYAWTGRHHVTKNYKCNHCGELWDERYPNVQC